LDNNNSLNIVQGKRKIYFPGLNEVRFIAAFFVILHHTEFIKDKLGQAPVWSMEYSSHLGVLGVVIFFVLSGFLITFLLLSEQESQKRIKVVNFYKRRILRIWPLYYLVLVLAFFIVPLSSFFYVTNYSEPITGLGTGFFLYCGLLANVALVYYPHVAFANVLWSVAVEEQFYLIWPHIVKVKKYFLKLVLGFLVFYLIFKSVSFLIVKKELLNSLINRMNYSSMLIGSIGAYLLYNKSKWLRVLNTKWLQYISLIFFIVILLDLMSFKGFNLFKIEIFSLVVCVLILNIAANEFTVIKIKNKLFNYLGSISYGLYVYHSFIIVAVLKFVPNQLQCLKLPPVLNYFILLVIILSLTVIVSHFSYKYFESFFLKYKSKYSSISSDR